MNQFFKKILFAFLCVLPLFSQAQSRVLVFSTTGMHEGLGATIELPSGDFITVGTQHSNTPNDVSDLAIYRISRVTGQVMWTRTWGTAASDMPNDAIFQNGQVVVCGESFNQSNSNLDAYVLKLDTFGNVVAHHPFGVTYLSESFYAMDGTPDGGVALTGFITGVQRSNDTWVVKLDAAGTKLWERTDGGARIEVGMGVVALPDGSIAVSGDKQKFDLSYNAYCLRYDSNGQLIWRTFIQSFQNGGCKSIMHTRENELLIVGEMNDTTTTFFDVYLVKLDMNGQMLWQKNIPGWQQITDAGMDVVQKRDGAYAIAGFGGNPAQNGDRDALLIETDSSGAVLRTQFFGNVGDGEFVGRLIVSQFGGLVLTGSADGANGSSNLLIFDGLQPAVSGLDVPNDLQNFEVFPSVLTGAMQFRTTIAFDALECYDMSGRYVTLFKSGEMTWQLPPDTATGKYFLRGQSLGTTHVSAIMVLE